MSENIIKSDFLAKGLTVSSKIFGVPFGLAISNISINFVLCFISCLVMGSVLPIIIFLSTMVGTHLLLKTVLIKDDKAVEIMLKSPLSNGSPKNGYLNSYAPSEKVISNKSQVRLQEKSTKKHIPYDVFQDEYTIFTRDGRLLQFISIEGISFSTIDDASIVSFKNIRSRILKKIASPDIAIQYYLVKNKTNIQLSEKCKYNFSQNLFKKYQDNINTRGLFEHTYYLVITHKGGKKASNDFISKAADFFTGEDADMSKNNEEATKELTRISDEICAQFKSENAKKLKITSKEDGKYSEQLTFLSHLINLEPSSSRVPNMPICEYINRSNHKIARSKGVIKITSPSGKSKYGACLHLKEYPDLTTSDMFEPILEQKVECVLSQSFDFIPTQKAIRSVNEKKRQMEKSEASASLAEELLIVDDDLKAGRVELGNHCLTLFVYSDSEAQLQEDVHTLESKLNQQSGLVFTRETEGVELSYWSLLPGNQRYSVRKTQISTLNLAAFQSPHNYPKGKHQGNRWGEALMVLETLAQTPYYFNVHVGQVATTSVCGPSGTGKTFFVATILAMSMKYGGRRFIFDKDNSMATIVRALGGTYHKLKMGIKTGMAPLQMQKSETNISFNEFLLKRILRTEKPLTDDEEKVINSVVNRAFELPKHQRTYSNIAPLFGSATSGSLRSRFDKWHGTGANAWVFDNETDSFDMDSAIYGLDVTGLIKEEFEEVKTPIFMYFFERMGMILDGSPTMINIPEAWHVLSDPFFNAQIDNWSRTNRKDNVALIMDTQAVDELGAYPSNDGLSGGKSFGRESVTQIFFANEKASFSQYESLNVTPKEFDIIKHDLFALKNNFYFLLKQGGKSVVTRACLKGLANEIKILSPSKSESLMGDVIAEKTDSAADFRELFIKECDILNSEFKGNHEAWYESRGKLL